MSSEDVLQALDDARKAGGGRPVSILWAEILTLQAKLAAAEAVIERVRYLVEFAYGEGFVNRSSSLPEREDIAQGWYASASFKGLNHADSQSGKELD